MVNLRMICENEIIMLKFICIMKFYVLIFKVYYEIQMLQNQPNVKLYIIVRQRIRGSTRFRSPRAVAI